MSALGLQPIHLGDHLCTVTTTDKRRARPPLKTAPATSTTTTTTPAIDLPLMVTSDVALLLSNPDHLTTYSIPKVISTLHTPATAPSFASCLSSPIRVISTRTHVVSGTYQNDKTVGNILVHLGCMSLQQLLETDRVRLALSAVNESLLYLSKQAEHFILSISEKIPFQLSGGGAKKNIYLTDTVNGALGDLSGKTGIAKGTLAAVAIGWTLSHQPQYLSPHHAHDIAQLCTDFRDHLAFKAVAIESTLEEARKRE